MTHRYYYDSDAYQPYTAGSRDTETGGDQFVDQFFMTGDDIRAELGSAAYPAGYPHFGATDRSLRDLADACRARGSFLAATSAGDEADKVVGDSCQNAMGQLANDATEANIGATGERVGYRPLKVQLVTEINEPISPNEDFIRITPVKSDSNEIPIFTDVPKTLDGGEGPVDGWISRSAFSNAGMIQTPMTIWNRDPADDSIPYTEGDGAQNISSGVELHKVYRDSMETSETPFHYMIQIEYNLPNVGALWCNATGGQHRATYVVDGRCLVDFGL